jgi:putative DNA-invertase from lambdoid prophage Rac
MVRDVRAARENKGVAHARFRGAFGGRPRAAIYARVSTADQQTIPDQVRRLSELALHRGWKVVRTVREVASGAAKREQRDELLASARRGELDAILVWKLDRWGRSVADLVSTLNELTALGVTFVSLTEALDLSTPSGRALAGMLAVFAEFERDMLRERVRAGLQRVREEGKKIGRPATAARHIAKVHELRARNLTQAAIARVLGIGESSVRRLLKAHRSRAVGRKSAAPAVEGRAAKARPVTPRGRSRRSLE